MSDVEVFFGPDIVAQGRRGRAAASIYEPLLCLLSYSEARALWLTRGKLVPGTRKPYRAFELAWRKAKRGRWHVVSPHVDGVRVALAKWLSASRNLRRVLRDAQRLEPFTAPKSRDGDYYFWLAAAGIAAFMKDIHRSRRGDLDGNIRWSDVVCRLKQDGHQDRLGRLAKDSDPAKAIERGVTRFLKKHHPEVFRAMFPKRGTKLSSTGRVPFIEARRHVRHPARA